MFLKRIEVKGFKSFADEMNIEFVPGVTAVVGPNGSGKSNISDSIRWVLGEQSARSLRGAKMEDVIFAGSDTRRALNLAEVTLVLDNEEDDVRFGFSEICVTRRLYRSGDSEYLLNRQLCRRKDIVELFMDSGLGKEAFSIIGQGRVEEVLSSKPEERRAIFEEAAGVLKYKQRKHQAEKKLTETEDNLHRVEDILFELESQVEPLRMQASMAKEFLTKKEELAETDISLTVYEITDRHEKWSSLESETEQLERKIEAQTAEIDTEEQKLVRVRNNAEATDEDIAALQERLLHTSEQMEKEEGRRLLLAEKGKNAEEKKADWEKRHYEQQQKQQQISKELAQQEKRLLNKQKQVKELKNKLADLDKKIEVNKQSRHDDIESQKSEYIERLNEQAAIRNEERSLTEQIENMKRKSAKLESENEGYLEARVSAEKTALDKESKKERAATELQSLLDKHAQLQNEYKQLSSSADQQETKLYEAFRHLDQAKSRIQMLEEMEADYSGFYTGVKEVLKARDHTLSGIVGAVAELIDVPKKYVTAIETALGGALQHVITKTEKDARQAIQYLKSRRKGRATFLPAEVIKKRSLTPSLRKIVENAEGYVSVASEAIEVAEEFKHIVDNLLGQIVIAANLDAANKIARAAGYRVRIVTIEGDVINPGGSMSGGAARQSNNQLLGRQGELEEWKQKLEKMNEKTRQLEKDVATAKEKRNNCGKELEKCRADGENARSSLDSLKEMLRDSRAELDRANSRLSLYDKEAVSLQEELERLTNRKNVLAENKQTVAEKLERINKSIQSLEQQEKNRSGILEDLQSKHTETNLALAAAKETEQHEKAGCKRLRLELDEYEDAVSKLEQELNILEEQLDVMNSSEKKAVDLTELSHQKTEITNKMEKLREQRRKESDESERLDGWIRQLQQRKEDSARRLHEQQLTLNRLDVELDTKLAKLQETYELTYERAQTEYVLAAEPEEAARKIKLLKMDIEELGSVNIGAIDEFDRISERVTFLSGQREDLLEARQSLDAVMKEMDSEVEKRFSETFANIRSHFQETFTDLFGGGEADLHLTTPDNLLETGVDIHARPPGKKRQHLTLLSGGEKALTAIALLFSIVKVKPVPFCVLDEVEAALDEANVARFARYLRTFSEDTQFIVISHRKATMEEADVLYGITMEESGVSKMVSVRLEETEELIEV
ncbi:chromosome segregation protein SMC [Alteribacillus sp. HJP-4]|uniref:chromosome segregation protein SMC n=1 Tax=Alteribacillus sp. HJP-4 TaxID=2775394 RepID=UPI0035CD0E08